MPANNRNRGHGPLLRVPGQMFFGHLVTLLPSLIQIRLTPAAHPIFPPSV